MNYYRIEAITSWEDLAQLKPIWEKFQWHPGVDYDFFNLVVRGRSAVISPCVFVLLGNDGIISILVGRIEHTKLPFRLGYANIGKIPVRRLVLMEGGFMGERGKESWSAFLQFISDYLDKAGLDMAFFESVSLQSPEYQAANALFSRFRLSSTGGYAEHWLLRLPKTYEEFMAARSKKRRYWLNRLPRVLDKEFPGTWRMVRYTEPGEVDAFAAAAESVARKTYHRGLGVGFHANQETLSRLSMEARKGQLNGYVLFINGEAKAFWHCFTYSDILYLASTGYDPEFGSYEVGTILLLKVFQDFCGTRIATVDFGLGDAEYKQRYGSEHFAETTLLLFAKTFRAFLLNILRSIFDSVNQSAKELMNSLRLTQRLKKFWRKGKVAQIEPGKKEPGPQSSDSIATGHSES